MSKLVNPWKALSVRQPWAWLIVHGWKNIENRVWPTAFRGRWVVHASSIMTRGDYDGCRLFCASAGMDQVAAMISKPKELPRAGYVGFSTILDCVAHHESEWFAGDWGFVLDPAEAVSFPVVPARGQLGFWTPSPADYEAIMARVAEQQLAAGVTTEVERGN